jgi:hypothetical protein
MSPRAFVFSTWLANGRTAQGTILALEAIAANQHSVLKEGGKTLVSASMGGKSYSLTIPPDFTVSTVAELALRCWQLVKDMTDAELETWLTRRTAKSMYVSIGHQII